MNWDKAAPYIVLTLAFLVDLLLAGEDDAEEYARKRIEETQRTLSETFED